MSDVSNKLKILHEEAMNCTKCELHKTRKQVVFSRGNISAKIMIVGESPGQDEDELGKPFVGKSGQLLNQALTDIGLDINNDIYVCNIIKCRPPDNRKPTEEESNTCFPYLESQIELIQPKIIVALGATAMDNLIDTGFGITKMRGKLVRCNYGNVICCFHPSFILRSGGTKSLNYLLFKSDLQFAIDQIKQ